jgi:thiamine-phosphate pyrophosphorylase
VERLHSARLYVLCSALDSASDFELRARALVQAGVDVLQLRDKRLPDRQLLQRAKTLRAITADSNTLFIMNDRADLACLSDADGVHVGQDELELQDARMLVGPDKLVGVSTHSVEQALEAQQAGADYIGCGPVFSSETKPFAANELQGDKLLRAISTIIRMPAFAIGGITAENLSAVLAAGFQRVAVQNAVWHTDDPARAARQLRAAFEQR